MVHLHSGEPDVGRATPGVPDAGQATPGEADAAATAPAPDVAAEAETGDARARQGRPATVAYARGEEVFAPGTGHGLVYIVRTGCVRISKALPDGRAVALGLLGPGTVFAQEDPADPLATGATAEALVDSALAVVPAADLAALVAESPELAGAVVAGMTRRLTELQTLVEHLLVREAGVRLAAALLALGRAVGRPTADGLVALALPLTHQELANMVGANRVTVTRKLVDLQRQGLVRSLGRTSLAVHPDRLRDWVASQVRRGS